MTVPSIHSFIQCRVHNSVLQYVFASCALVAFSSISDCIMHFQCTLFEYIYPKFDTNMLNYDELYLIPDCKLKQLKTFHYHHHTYTHARTRAHHSSGFPPTACLSSKTQKLICSCEFYFFQLSYFFSILLLLTSRHFADL